jgi:hypothetical protein
MSSANDTKRVLFFAPFGSYTVHHQFDAVVASAARLRGAHIAVVRCDGVIGMCDQFAWSADQKAVCSNCKGCGDPFFEAFDLPIIQLKAALTDQDIQTVEAWSRSLDPAEYISAKFNDIPIGNWCTSSLFSFYRITSESLSNPAIRQATAEAHRRLLISGALVYIALERIIGQTKPTHMFCFNARYAAYRVAFEVAKLAGVEVITHERGHADGTFTVFSNYGSIQTAPAFDGYQVWKDVALNKTELERVKRYFVNREQGTDSNFEPFLDFSTDYATVRSLLRVPPEARMIGVFTSSEYEFDLCADYDTFVDQLELIERLVRVFRERPDDYLIVRHHPYLGGNASSLADHGFISRAYEIARRAPPNVRFVMPGERLNSYALINNLDGAISFLSTAGVEAVARGVATACFKESVYRDALSSLIEDDGKVYLNDLIDDLMERTRNFGIEDLRRLYRFQGMLISKLSNRFETFGIKSTFASDVKTEKFVMLVNRGDEALDRVCDHVFYDSPLLPQPTLTERARSTADEDIIHASTLREIQRVRGRTREEAKLRCRSTSDEGVSLILLGGMDVIPVGLEASRHINIEISPVDLVTTGTYSELISAIRNSSGKFISITTPQIEYDEAFFSYNVDQLEQEGDRIIGVLAGAWIREDGGRIVDQIFSKRTPDVSLEWIKALCPSVVDEPYRLLSLALVRRDAALSFLEGLGTLSLKSSEALEKIYEWISREGFMRSLGHGVVMPR